ncbi:MAG: GDP-mannose 4,6-dehydratase [Planctomycetes bacterium]|nr:GDP-mannose 4,6-dehydratase [Planctomycetota bacterium]
MSRKSKTRVTLVTGGAGFIGSHLVAQLLSRGECVTVIDNLSTGRLSNLDDLPRDNLTIINAKVGQAINNLDPAQFHSIYHLAAAVGVRLVVEDPIHTIHTNVLETSAILEFASSASTPILIASTSEVYGKSTKTPFNEKDDVTYGPPSQTRFAYACSKSIDEHLALAHNREHDLPVVIARFFNIVGPRQVGQYGMVLPRFVSAALGDKKIEVYGDGRQTRCFCDVRDVVKLLPTLLDNPKCLGEVFNIGNDEQIEIGELAKLVCKTLSSQSEIAYIPYDVAFGPDFDDLKNRQPDLSHLQNATGFRATTPLTQTINDLAKQIKCKRSSAESLA